MEFSYGITESEYVRACQLGRNSFLHPVAKKVLFWVFVLLCLMLLWAIVQKTSYPPAVLDDPTATQSLAVEPANKISLTRALFVNVGPFVLLAVVWVFLVNLGPKRLRRVYKKDPLMQGQFTVSLTSESISIQNTAGTSAQTGWNIYSSWREKNGIIVLILRSGPCFAMSLASLTEPQKNELRGVLSKALPRS